MDHRLMKIIRLFLLLPAVICYGPVYSGTVAIPEKWVDAKYCGRPLRNAAGEIIRSTTAIKYFRLQNPCPSTGLTTGACPDHSIDHPRPLAKCGCDHPTNMQWLKNSIKNCAGTECKDRWEQKAYQCKPEVLP